MTPYYKSKKGVITVFYSTQRKSSKERGHPMPNYSNKDLQDWLYNDWLFNLLYDNWVNCDYIKDIKPSLDRLDDTKPYSFDNIQLMTWGDNLSKSSKDKSSGKLKASMPLRPVAQFTKQGEYMAEYFSMSEAARQSGVKVNNIWNNLNGVCKSSGGFVWKYNDL